MTAAFQPLEQVRSAKAHEPLAGTREVLQKFGLALCGWFVWRCGNVIAQPITGQVELVDGIDDIRRIEPRILISGIAVIDSKFNGPRNTCGKIGSAAVFKGQKLSSVGRVGLRIVFLNKASGSSDHIQPHELSPVIGI